MTIKRIYLDVSVLNRPFDDQTEPRNRLEAEVTMLLIEAIEKSELVYVSSDMALNEINENPDEVKKNRVLMIHLLASEVVAIDEIVLARAREIATLGIDRADSVHIAAAEHLRADAFLTCDDRLLRAAARNGSSIKINVMNPLNWTVENINAIDTQRDTT